MAIYASSNLGINQEIYVGEVVYLNTENGEIVAKGSGYTNLSNLEIVATLNILKGGDFKKILTVIKTQNHYIAPFVFYRKNLHKNEVQSIAYTFKAYLQWSIDGTIEKPLHGSNSIQIIIQAQHAPDTNQVTIASGGVSEKVTRHAYATKIATAKLNNILLEVSSGYKIYRNAEYLNNTREPELKTYARYKFSTEHKNLSIGDMGNLLLAFRLHWLIYSRETCSQIDSVQFGTDITLHLKNNTLHPVDKKLGNQTLLKLSQIKHNTELIKMAHFFINPNHIDNLGPSSKLGLSLARLVDYHFNSRSNLPHAGITGLIFALQGFAESIAEQEIRGRNRTKKQENLRHIETVLSAIRPLKSQLSKEVYQFYMRDKDTIYKALARPTFMQSINICLAKLSINPKIYRSMLKSIEKARRQIVHSEGYDVEYIINLLVNTSYQSNISETDNITRGTTSEVEQLYKLLREMALRYFKSIHKP